MQCRACNALRWVIVIFEETTLEQLPFVSAQAQELGGTQVEEHPENLGDIHSMSQHAPSTK